MKLPVPTANATGHWSKAASTREERLAQPLPREVECQHRDEERDAGEKRQMPVFERIVERLPQQPAPARRRRLHAEPEKTQSALGENRPRHAEREADQDRSGDVRQQMHRHRPPRRDPHHFATLDVRQRTLLEHFAAHEECKPDPSGQPNHRDHHQNRLLKFAVLQNRHQNQQQQKSRETEPNHESWKRQTL